MILIKFQNFGRISKFLTKFHNFNLISEFQLDFTNFIKFHNLAKNPENSQFLRWIYLWIVLGFPRPPLAAKYCKDWLAIATLKPTFTFLVGILPSKSLEYGKIPTEKSESWF